MILGLVLIIAGAVHCFFNGFPFGDIFENIHRPNADESYYELFGMTRATFDENALKKSYRTLLKKYHPDHSEEPDASERFGEITHAYEVLSDPEKKRLYDMHGKDGVKMGGASGNGDPNANAGFPFNMYGHGIHLFLKVLQFQSVWTRSSGSAKIAHCNGRNSHHPGRDLFRF